MNWYVVEDDGRLTAVEARLARDSAALWPPTSARWDSLGNRYWHARVADRSRGGTLVSHVFLLGAKIAPVLALLAPMRHSAQRSTREPLRRIGTTVELAAATQPPGRAPRYLASTALASLLAAIIVVVATSPGSSRPHSSRARSPYRTVSRVPPYWTVRSGDTYAQIAKKTGLTIDQLQAFNPRTDPHSLLPGQRVKLWLHPPPPRPKPLLRVRPYWTVRRGDTYAQIAKKTGLTIDQLQAFNPRTDPRGLLPGQRVKLWLHPPPPRPKPLPRFWIVRRGQSFGLIAAKTGIKLVRLKRLNPELKPTTLQPGDRLRLRR
jgi:LysM repeat protein